MKHSLSFALLVASMTIHAEIYRGVDEEGNVFYSDKEQTNTELIPTPTPNAVSMPKLEAKKPVAEKTQKRAYKLFSISSPVSNASIRDNLGNLSINLAIEPALDKTNHHKIVIYLDGKVATSATTALPIQLSNITRGKHILQAKVIDENGMQIISSNSVTIHMKRLSSQHGKPSGTPPGPQTPEGQPYTPGPQGVFFKPGPAPIIEP